MRGLSPLAASGDHPSSRCAGLSLSRPLPLQSTGSRSAGSVAVAHGPSRSAACGIFPDQGSNPCPLHWQADSQPLRHQGSPCYLLASKFCGFIMICVCLAIIICFRFSLCRTSDRTHFPCKYHPLNLPIYPLHYYDAGKNFKTFY